MDTCLCVKVWLDQQSQRYAIQQGSLREETQNSSIKCCMDCLATIVAFLNNRSLSCVEISCISAEHLAKINVSLREDARVANREFLRK